MKRVLASILVLMMVLLALVSCGSDPAPVNPDPQESSEEGGGSGGFVFEDEEEEADWWEEVDLDGETLMIQLSSINTADFPNGSDKYLRGPDTQLDSASTSGFEKVQNAVFLRNKTVQSQKGLNVKIDYCYIDKDWGSAKGEIIDIESTYGSSNTPDIYVDMEYDMMGAACEQGVFANILKYTDADDGYFDISKENGYYVSYMDDLSLSKSRQALIASDYFMDVLRAMTVLPFNLELYSSYAATDDPDAEKLYASVIDGEWTWEKLMTYQNVYSGTGKATLTDTVLLSLNCGGVSATAFLYSTAYKTYSIDDDGNYSFNSTSDLMYKLFRTAGEIANSNGVLCDVFASDVEGFAQANEVFTSGNALFCNPNVIGIIEEDDFQSMSKLSILPCPKYSEDEDYSTVINSRARVGALSYHSEKQVQASAFLQYVTVNSDTVKDEYFNKAMSGKYLVGSGAGEILTLIYDCIGDNKSLVLDNLVLNRDWSAKSYVMSQLVKEGFFQTHVSDVSSLYTSAVQAKNMILDKAVSDWNACD